MIVAIGLALAVLWLVPWWVESRRAYRLRQQAIQLVAGELLAAASKEGLKVDELHELLGTIGEVATSQRETARAVMSFMLITVVGVALAALLLSSSGDAGDLRKTLITSILTLLGTIVGFYFGSRATEAESAPAAPPLPPLVAHPAEAAPTPGGDYVGAAWAPSASAVEEAPPAASEGESPGRRGSRWRRRVLRPDKPKGEKGRH